MSINLVRHVIDIQNQINNLNEDLDTDKLNSLLEYNTEIKKSLLENVKDNFILEKIEEIPIFSLDNFKLGFDFIGFIVGVFSKNFDAFNDQKIDYGKAKEALNEINSKYASLEKILENSASL